MKISDGIFATVCISEKLYLQLSFKSVKLYLHLCKSVKPYMQCTVNQYNYTPSCAITSEAIFAATLQNQLKYITPAVLVIIKATFAAALYNHVAISANAKLKAV